MTLTFPDEVVLLDTDVCSMIFGSKPEAEYYLPYLENRTGAVSFITVAELWRWAYKNNWQQRRMEDLERYLDRFVDLPYEPTVAQRWGLIQSMIRGKTYPPNRAWVAASAIAFNCPLLTHNRTAYNAIRGLQLITAPE